MKMALLVLKRRLPMVVLAMLATGALACSSSKTADQTGDDVATDAATDDAALGSDATATDAGLDTSDVQSKTDVADDAAPDVAPQCVKNTECNDGDPCTDNVCLKGVCSNPYNAGPCDDGDPCTQNDYCKQGTCAGKGQCTDTTDDTGPDTTGDTSGDATGDVGPTAGCGQAEWQSTLNDGFITALGKCGTGCIQALTAQCLSDCIATSGNLSTPCADCFGELGVCVGNKCLTECLTSQTSQQCKDCAAQNCGNALSTCSGFPAPNCAADADCDDKSACTADSCANMFCQHVAKACDDGNACTADSCDAVKGCVGVALPSSVTCNDGNTCTENDNCGTGTCTGAAKNCDDLNPCTADSCDPTNGCVNSKLSGTTCDDGNAATIADTCDTGVCKGSVPDCLDVTQCDDSLACTTDSCEPVTHTCKHAIVTGNCLIAGACFADGQGNPANGCQACAATTSNNGWNTANESFTCGTAGTCAAGSCVDPWPPTAPLANGKICALPTCDAASKPAFYTGGNWTVTTKTVSTTCNSLIQLVEPRANVGYTKTGNAHPMNFVGGCDYAPGGTTAQVGTIVSNVEASCEVKVDATYGVTSVQTSVVTFGAGKGTGTATATLFDLPAGAGQLDNSCEIVFQVTVQHVPDCTLDGDCDDGIACTADTCSSGLCLHGLAANTCLIGGQCIADGAYQGSTGNASCRLCAGKAPSQYGWIILSSGETCDDGDVNTSPDKCGIAGTCTGPNNN